MEEDAPPPTPTPSITPAPAPKRPSRDSESLAGRSGVSGRLLGQGDALLREVSELKEMIANLSTQVALQMTALGDTVIEKVESLELGEFPRTSVISPPPPPLLLQQQRPPSPPEEKPPRPAFTPTYDPAVVLNFVRGKPGISREAVCMHEILDDDGKPSWEKLVKILAKKISKTAVFDEESDMMVFDDKVRVQNERQFLAALQWAENAGHGKNIHVLVYEVEFASRMWGNNY